ncbi:hypothetical protein RsoM2USA_322 [Ralstonia phage RsoM2USA]|nr:hypothetical protein RsoM2USA_322 [Ralstonia phage RsoM2USA]
MILDVDQYRRGLWSGFIENNLRVARIEQKTNRILGLEIPNHMICDTHVWFGIDRKCLRVIEKSDKRDEFEELKFPFISSGVSKFQVNKRTITEWDHLPTGIERISLIDCIIPNLDNMPEFPDIRVETSLGFNGSIINMFENTCKSDGRQASFTLTNHTTSDFLLVYRWYNEPIRVQTGYLTTEIRLNDVFELQSWLMDNDFSRLA